MADRVAENYFFSLFTQMTGRNYYEKFGISKNATDAEIKTAYRKLALQYHPDKNNGSAGSEILFKEINNIYQILSDPAKRYVYDLKLRNGVFEETYFTHSPHQNTYQYYSPRPTYQKTADTSNRFGFTFFRWIFVVTVMYLINHNFNNSDSSFPSQEFQQINGKSENYIDSQVRIFIDSSKKLIDTNNYKKDTLVHYY